MPPSYADERPSWVQEEESPRTSLRDYSPLRAGSVDEITLREGDPEIEQEWAVARTLSIIKIVLATANFYVILLDHTVPLKNDPVSLRFALWSAVLLWLYTVGAYSALRKRLVSIRVYEWVTPLLDVALSALLIYSTDGYESPFNTWLVLGVVATGFSSDRRIPILTTLLAVAVHFGMARIPQEEPLSMSLLAVRTSYPFGYAAIVVALGGALARQARALGVVERMGAALGAAKTTKEATDLLFTGLRRLLGAPAVEFTRDDGLRRSEGGATEGTRRLDLDVRTGTLVVAKLEISRKRAFSDSERRWAEILCERYGACVRRLRLSEELLQASARAERMRMADEMHDGHLQTLTAIGFFLEAKRMRGEGEDLHEICSLVRQATQEARTLLLPRDDQLVGGEAHIREIFRTRWRGAYSVEIDPDIELSEGKWLVLEAMVKEGLNNAKRHAEAHKASLRVKLIGDQILFSLESNGSPPGGHIQYGYGLNSLSMKAEANGGLMMLSPAKGGGACLSIVFDQQKDQ